MLLLHRNTTPTPIADPPPLPNPDALADGLSTIAEDLRARDDWAINVAYYLHEMTHDEIAAYPTSPERQARIRHFGKPGPGQLPDPQPAA